MEVVFPESRWIFFYLALRSLASLFFFFHSISYFLWNLHAKDGYEQTCQYVVHPMPIQVLFSPLISSCPLIYDFPEFGNNCVLCFFFSWKAGNIGQIACCMVLIINPLLAEAILSN